jgi:predicted glycosyltransferase
MPKGVDTIQPPRILLLSASVGVGHLRAAEAVELALRETAVRTEIVVVRSDSAAKAFVGAGGVSPAEAGVLGALLTGGKCEYCRRFFLRWRGGSLCPA